MSDAGAGIAPSPKVPARVWRNEIVATLKLAGPLVLTQLAVIALNATDVVMMGWLGPGFLAGGALGSNLYMPLFLFGLGIVIAVAPLTAQALGAGETDAVRRIFRQGMWVGLSLGGPFGLVLWQARPVLLLFGQAEANALMAESYLRAALWGLVPSFWFIVLRAFVTAHSRPRAALFVTLAGVVLNALGDYALMFGNFGFPRLELLGAGIMTAIVQTFMFLTLLLFVLFDPKFKDSTRAVFALRPDWPRFCEILSIGFPIGLTILAESALFATASLLMGILGTDELAAHAVAVQCAAIAFMIPLGIGQAVTVRVGLAAGRGDRTGIGRAGWCGLVIGLCLMVGSAALFWFGGGWIMGLYLDVGDPANQSVIAFGVAFLAIAGLFQFADGAQVILVGALRGLKDTRVPMVIAYFGYWIIGFPLCALLAFKTSMRGEGIWIGLAFGLIVVALLAGRRFMRRGLWDPATARA